jgi:hypothetical protein
LTKSNFNLDANHFILILKILRKEKQKGAALPISILNYLEKKFISFLNCMDERELLDIYHEYLNTGLASIDLLEKLEKNFFPPDKEEKI